MSGERKGERASARSTTSAYMDGALSWDKRRLPSAQYGAGSSGFQNVSIKAGIALVETGKGLHVEFWKLSIVWQSMIRAERDDRRNPACDSWCF